MVQRKNRTKLESEPVTEPLTYLRAIRYARNLSPAEKLTATVILSHAGPDCQHAHPGNVLLAEETGYHVSTVKAATESLRRKHYLMLAYSGRGGRHDRANEYSCSIPKSPETTLDGPKSPETTLGDTPNIPKSPEMNPKVASDGSQSRLSHPRNALRNALRNAPELDSEDTQKIDPQKPDPRDLVQRRYERRLKLARDDSDRERAQRAYEEELARLV